MKLLGAVLLLCSGVGLTFLLITRQRRIYLQTAALAQLLEFTRGAVKNYAMPMGDILSSCDGELLWRCGCGERRPKSFSELAETCCISDAESRRILSEFAYDFGRVGRAEQAERCAEYSRAMEKRREQLGAEESGRKKLIAAVVLSLTLMALILLM